MTTINKKEIKAEAKQLLQQDISKQEVFDLLVEKHNNKTEIVKIINTIPSAKALANYGIWNHVLLGILILTVILYLVFTSGSAYGVVLWYGILIYFVATKRTSSYLWITAVSAFTIIAFIAIILTSTSETTYWTNSLIMLALIIPSTFLPIWLQKKLCPKPKEEREEYITPDGFKRTRVKYVFVD